ncbi:leucyl-tRNA--protein transferase [Intrasporangium oryzae NRRL B-24470]|uniref:Leucyl/phenylalanyl-tRNA--protein transferase n=1 Tax=Intrasporangium oryzae NRRL B-24470 TaxID=1386089 RepID=W9G5J0_9MICO|nr:leucyl/phenylalanyl-tRNA--protein transferase [Intrasporangium oryzae]EWT00567.1 leucyl-tRNA--protein transferase [Intrasporangium oryzae NRRL B-24470]
MPIPPPPTAWDFGLDRIPRGEDLVGIGADLEVATLYEAYTVGLFPMGVGEHGAAPIGWWSPDPRGILRVGDLHVSRSLRKSLARFELRVDTVFDEVVAACAAPDRDGRWITQDVASAYSALHEAGWAHSVETWRAGRLVGGLYGVAIGGLFAGESMFHAERDASKVALVGLHELLAADADPRRLIDVQWQTPHLATLGVTEVSREAYLDLLETALTAPLPAPWA